MALTSVYELDLPMLDTMGMERVEALSATRRGPTPPLAGTHPTGVLPDRVRGCRLGPT